MKNKIINFFDDFKDIFKKNFNNKKKVILVVGVLFILLFVIFIVYFLSYDNVISGIIINYDGVKIKNQYVKLNGVKTEDGNIYPEVTLSSKNKFKYTDVEEFISFFDEKKDAVVYFGYPSCLYCRSTIEVLSNVALSSKIDRIYYLEINDKIDGYSKLIDVLDDKFIDKEKNQIYSPLVMFIEDGKIVSYKIGTLFSQKSPYDELDKDQIYGLGEIYKRGIQDVLGENNKMINKN